jgi:hypothetical protein
VQAFLILERVAGSKEFLLSVLLQSNQHFIGKSSLGTVAEGQKISLSLRWDEPRRRFVATAQTAEGAPILSFIPFASPRTADGIAPREFSMEKFVRNSRDNKSEAHAALATNPSPRTSIQ